MKITICAFLFFISKSLCAQIVFSGKIISTNNQPIPRASIVLIKRNQLNIFAFAISDNNGMYKITCNENPDSVNIKVSAIGFGDTIKPLARHSQIINFTLTEKETKLPTVKVKSNPVTLHGDTTDYNVSSFATNQDRVIGDVIAKLPGIEIDPNGAIKYNGKLISNYYINGLDLLENRYGIANGNIPYDLVDKVQILNNHQPVKVLDSLKNSTNPALNIELKKKGMNKFIGTAKAGAGISPFLSDDAIVSMKFNKNFQFITAYKYNNTGIRLSNELTQQVLIQDINAPKPENVKENLLSLISLPAPILQEPRYIFNNNHLFHLSAIKVLKNTGQIKFNIGYINDYNKSTGSNATTLFLPSDTIKFIENLKTGISTNKLNGDFYYTLNKRNKYIKNASKIQLDFNNEKGSIENTGNVYQNLNNPFYQFENNFLMLTPIKKKLVSFKSNTFFNRTPQDLSVRPGQFTEVFNDSLPYDQITQKAVLNKFISDNSVAFFTKIGQLEGDFDLGAEYSYKQISSSLTKENNQTIYQLNDSFQNKLNWQNIRLYGNANTTIKMGEKQISITLPIELNNLSVNNKSNASTHDQSYLFFNPDIDLHLPYGSNFGAEIIYSHRNSLGNFIQTTPGFMLTNYRTINQNDSLLPVQRLNNISVSNYYKDPLQGLFCNVSVSYSNTNNNIIYTQSYDNIFSKTTAIQFPNSSKSVILSGRVNKYFFQSKTNIALSANYTWNKSLLIQQSDFVNIFTNSTTFSAKINYDNLNFLSVQNNAVFNIFSNTIKPFTKNSSAFSSMQFQEKLNLYFFLSKKTSLYFNSEYYNLWNKASGSNQYYFGDAGIKFTYKKTDFELGCNNITNNKYFTMFSLSDNMRQTTQTQIRPRTLMIKCYFKF
ncbi:MAG TPA: carboxypeptidase-like regulatory domain-containing protein [Hanamia sp.]